MVTVVVTVVVTVRNSPAFVAQQEGQQAAEDAGQAAVQAHQQCGGGAVSLVAVTGGTGWATNKQSC